MLRQQVLTAWNSCKEKLTDTIHHLKTRVNPEVIALKNQILTKTKEIEAKRKELGQLPLQRKEIGGSSRTSPTKPAPKQNNRELISKELEELERQEWLLCERLKKISPFLTSLKADLEQKGYQIKNLETLLKESQSAAIQQSDQKYEEQLQALQTNYEVALKKLDRVRNLVIDNSLESLKNLVKKGQI